jgi:protein-S-isoprenylcysteine O-methyltransferase Ste14
MDQDVGQAAGVKPAAFSFWSVVKHPAWAGSRQWFLAHETADHEIFISD